MAMPCVRRRLLDHERSPGLHDLERSNGEGAPRGSLRAFVRVPVPHHPPHYEWNIDTARLLATLGK